MQSLYAQQISKLTQSIDYLSTHEVWRNIQGFERVFQVSSFGRVRTLTRKYYYHGKYLYTHKGQIRKPFLTVYGYLQLRLINNYTHYHYTAPIHQLVAKAFLQNPQGFTEIHHLDYDKTNNNIKNLLWCSRKFNQQNMAKHYHLKKTKHCIDCGKPINYKATRCYNCNLKYRKTHINGIKVTKCELLQTIHAYHGNFTQVGRYYNTDSNIIRRHLKVFGLPYHASDYKN